MSHPFTVIEAHSVDTGWNDNSMLAILCDFVQAESVGNPQLAVRFEAYVSGRAADECAGLEG